MYIFAERSVIVILRYLWASYSISLWYLVVHGHISFLFLAPLWYLGILRPVLGGRKRR